MMTQEERIDIFEGFRKGMHYFLTSYQLPSGIKHRKTAIAHRLALCLSAEFPSYFVDIDTNGADIIVWDGLDDIKLALFWSEQYMTEKEKTKALEFHKAKEPGLTLGFTMLPDRPWLLVYRCESEYVEYLHIDKESFSDEVLRQKFLEDKDEGQLKLSLRKKRTKKITS